MGAAVHVPVLMREVLQHLALEPGLTVVDGTVGAGGHSREILKRIGPTGVLLGLDRDPKMLAWAAQKASGPNCHLIQASYAQLEDVLREQGLAQVDRVLLDLGLSSDQLADETRGFSFQSTGPLDLRFNAARGTPAWEWLARLSADELADIFHKYGEEPFSRRIAQAIVDRRKKQPIRTAADLTALIHDEAMPRHVAQSSRKEPATRVFQALRIFVNDELEQLEQVLGHVLENTLKAGGRAVIISFHSLEDRLVKNAFRDAQKWQILTPKPVVASAAETRANPRARTAKLRAATRL
jgi:16S rRNA (cytosine1402-N4)-methyltransferase